ncbi:hypothetical protein L1987_74726 [Smallanthus sonchifolius]|uniref:Uncharacterized protein n=1 Tax=Smallanthus sonchifolius TaxID=185202 RepID=A0ACB9A2S4_9ASTR|nr:hypothetical protein L1987_74726 [Smallanthus sonchifolius]
MIYTSKHPFNYHNLHRRLSDFLPFIPSFDSYRTCCHNLEVFIWTILGSVILIYRLGFYNEEAIVICGFSDEDICYCMQIVICGSKTLNPFT